MQLVYDNGGASYELDLRIHNPDATVADLVHALDPTGDGERPLVIDDRVAGPDLGLDECGLYEGAVVRLGAPGAGNGQGRGLGRTMGAPPPPAPRPTYAATPPTTPEQQLELAVIGGLYAGARHPLPVGTTYVGRRDPHVCDMADPTVSTHHASFTRRPDDLIEVTDLGSHNGTWLATGTVVAPIAVEPDTVVRLGGAQVVIRPTKADDRPLAVDPVRHGNVSGTMPFNRPPRPAPPPALEQLHVPEPPSKKDNRHPIQIAAIIAPLIFGAVMIQITGSVTFALFALLSPVMMIGSTIESRRRGKKGARKDIARFKTELAEFERRVAHAKALERWMRREAMPDPAEILRRATLPSVRVWERRPTHPDFLLLRGGIGTVRWEPPFDKPRPGRGEEWPDELAAIVHGASHLIEAPVPVELGNGGVVGLVGERAAALAVARSLLCQATTHSGPADLPVLLLTRPEAIAEWDWAKWLPHTRDASGTRLLSADSELSTRMVESFLRAGAERQDRQDAAGASAIVGPTLFVLVDDESLTEGRRAPTRSLLRGVGGPVAGIVIASTADRLPAVCTTVIELRGPYGDAVLDRPQLGERISLFHATGLDEPTARRCARALARFEDPELDIVGAGLPDRLRLLPLLELNDLGPEAIEERWRSRGPHPAPSAPIGVSEDGVFEVDLVADGPHGLVAGTTGAGKSELLRTLVAGLAASTDPDHLTFVLIDFKGGSAFDECSRLPHTVGMVTDLDEHLAERALRCLEAELKYRERLLRDAKANDLPDYLRKGAVLGPLPRLLVVIDEFATLKAELPDFIDALVGVAQRGRSLGVHMLLATQRPSGAVSENIRANTNLRIALRVQDKGDSTDVLDVPDAARIARSAAGRAYVRLGPGEVIAIQTALSTGKGGAEAAAPVELAPFPFGSAPAPTAPAPGDDGDAHITDLTLLVDAITTAFERSGAAAPRRPWPDDLPLDLEIEAVRADRERMRMFDGSTAVAGAVPIALGDDPDAQTQYPVGWDADDNLLVYGGGGSGTSSTLATIALALAADRSPDDLHIYALDFGAGELLPLTGLPHVGAVIAATERERQVRVISMLRAELDRRRDLDAAARAAEPTIVVMVDGFSAFYSDFDDLSGQGAWSDFQRLWNDGPEVNIVIVATGDRVGAIPSTMIAVVRDKLVLRLADKSDLGSFGIRSRTVPAQPPGRAIIAETGQIVQVARPADGLAAAVARVAAAAPVVQRPPAPIRTLPTEVGLGEVGPARLEPRPWFIPLGIGTRSLAPAGLTVYDGEHAVVSGPARSGKSTALLTVTTMFLGADPSATAYLVAGPRSPLGAESRFERTLSPAQITELPGLVEAATGRVIVAIDDAETFEDEGNALAGLLATHRAGFFLVAAGRNEMLRSLYSHWTRTVRRSKLGVLLRPDVDLDGELLGVQIPRRSAVAMSVGRGYICNGGEAELIQLAKP